MSSDDHQDRQRSPLCLYPQVKQPFDSYLTPRIFRGFFNPKKPYVHYLGIWLVSNKTRLSSRSVKITSHIHRNQYSMVPKEKHTNNAAEWIETRGSLHQYTIPDQTILWLAVKRIKDTLDNHARRPMEKRPKSLFCLDSKHTNRYVNDSSLNLKFLWVWFTTT